MFRITVGEFIDKEDWSDQPIEAHCIYIVHNVDIIFYIGKSADIVRRLWGHFGSEIHGGWPGFGRRASDLGRLIRANFPLSKGWYIDLLTLEDCGRYTIFNLPTMDIDTAEATLIQLLNPCLNRELNRRRHDDRLKAYKTPWVVSAERWPDFD